MTEKLYRIKLPRFKRPDYDNPVTYKAEAPFMDYTIEKYHDFWHDYPFEDGKRWRLMYHGDCEMDYDDIGDFRTLKEAKAAARAHYEDLIGRALEEVTL